MTGIDKAIEAAGTQEKLGAALKPPVSQQAIAKMKSDGYAPANRAKQIAKLFGIPLAELVDPASLKFAKSLVQGV